jgi:two-component system, sensor histidine kinase and response regulator
VSATRPSSDLMVGPSRTALSPELLHDLRSPLNQIIGYSEMLSEESDAQRDERVIADLERIRLAGQRILSLIEDNFTSSTEVAATTAMTEEEIAPAEIAGTHDVAGGVVLVVDDDPGNRDLLSRRLILQGHSVTTVSNGLDALYQMRDVAFDVVLLDIMMPDMDGYEVLRHIKADERLQHIPVVMISALNEVQSVVRCIEAGAEDYLAKPFNPTLLKARVGACLDKKRGRDRETALFEQLQENYKRLQEVEKLRDDMRNMIVHDLRTPLTAVIVGVEMLEKDGTLTESQHEMMAIAASSGKTLLGMINDLLDVEKMESGATLLQYEDVTPEKLVMRAIEQIGTLASDAGTTVATSIQPGLEFRADENKLSRTLVNLIANAIKFTPGGSVTVSAAQDGQNVRFEVRDTGDGIPAEAFERIFEKFGQLDSHSRVGTGLGLAFCKLAVEAHGGRIQVESTRGEGSTFSFTIPYGNAWGRSTERV